MKLDDVDGDDFRIEDRRGQGGGGLGGLGSVLGGGGKGAKIGIPALIVVVIGIFLSQAGGGGGSGTGGIDDILGQLSGQGTSQTAPQGPGGTKDAQYEFVGDVGSLLEDYWSSSFAASDQPFSKAGLVIFDAPTDTGGCGVGTPQAGPFYCPPSKKIFIDFGFYRQLEQQLGFELYPEDKQPEFFIAQDAVGNFLGVAIFIDPRTKPKILEGGILTLEVGIGVNAAGKINRIKVYDYRGNLELTKDSFLTQLRDKTLESEFTMGKGGLVAVVGEPEESQLVSNAAREALLLMKVALGRRE